MYFAILIHFLFFPFFSPVMEVFPRNPWCCWRVMGLSSHNLHSRVAKKYLFAFAFYFFLGKICSIQISLQKSSPLLPPKVWTFAVLPCEGEWLWGVPFYPLCSNSSLSNFYDVMGFLFRQGGLPQIFCCCWVSTQFFTMQVLPPPS